MDYEIDCCGCFINFGTLQSCIDKVDELKSGGAVGFYVMNPDTGEIVYE